MTDFNVRDVFNLYTGRCGHRWVAEHGYECPVCDDFDNSGYGQHVIATEPIAVDIGYVWAEPTLRRARLVREGRRRLRKTAAVITLAAWR